MIRALPLAAWCVLLPLAFALQSDPGERDEKAPSWIWIDSTTSDQEAVFRTTFDVDAAHVGGTLAGTCDDRMVVLLNGRRVGVHDGWEQVVGCDVSRALVPGANMLEVRAANRQGPAALALRLDLADGRAIVTDGTWRAALAQRAERDRWDAATVLGQVGAADLPWSARVGLADFRAPAGELRADAPGTPQAPRPAEGMHLLPGFEAELLYAVPNELQGSWVSLAKDAAGRLYASDQAGKGIYRIVPAPLGEADAETSVERVPVDVSGAQGMCWAFDSLYVNVNGRGVFRLRDTDGDGRLDAAEHLVPLGSGGEHGPHAIVPTEDGTGLYFVGGNHVAPPRFDSSRAPSNWGEDLLLPRQWDAQGHARGILAPGGWVARCDPDGRGIEILSNGYRNQYDIALDPHGEMFTYDSDMEWDIGTPWYRPTRVCHVTSGSEFGWRAGTGKWPATYEDSVPPILEVGPGSPTGVVFGTGAAFPARYQQALFVLDWTFGTIYALHLEPAGASYTATKEHFAWAKPLGVTDAVVGDDGALYFTVGGRGSQSALYRIRYTGPEPTQPVTVAARDAGTDARALRRSLEAFHGRVDPRALDAAWPQLASADRFVRFAARIAIENQPVATWRERALAEREPRAAVAALVALARQGEPSDLPAVLAALARLDLPRLDEPVLLGALRAYGLAFVRLVAPDTELAEDLRAGAIAALDPLFPASSAAVDAELAALLTYLRAPTVVSKTMALLTHPAPTVLPPWAELIRRNDVYGGPIARMLADPPPTQEIGYALTLRNATEGWTLPLRKQYFAFFVEASAHPGGASYAGFLENIRREAEDTLSVAERRSLASVLGQPLVSTLPAEVTPIAGPGRPWTRDEALDAVGRLTGRDYAAGRNLFHAATCSACHRFDGVGGSIGPDLTTVANKFSVADILEAIVEPSKVISDQYAAHVVVDQDGRVAEGIVVEDGDEVTVYSRVVGAEPTTFLRSEIASIAESRLSQMPTGLLDGMNPDELRDLLAYLLSGGDEKAEVFRGAEQAGGR